MSTSSDLADFQFEKICETTAKFVASTPETLAKVLQKNAEFMAFLSRLTGEQLSANQGIVNSFRDKNAETAALSTEIAKKAPSLDGLEDKSKHAEGDLPRIPGVTGSFVSQFIVPNPSSSSST